MLWTQANIAHKVNVFVDMVFVAEPIKTFLKPNKTKKKESGRQQASPIAIFSGNHTLFQLNETVKC